MNEADGRIVLPPGDGRTVRYLGTTMTIKVPATATGGAFSLAEAAMPPGPLAGPPAHMHPHAETFYVLAGRMRFLVGEGELEVEAGGVAYVPGGVVHTFANAGPEPARFLGLFVPGGFEGYFEELGALMPDAWREPADTATIARIAARYGQQIVGPPLTV